MNGQRLSARGRPWDVVPADELAVRQLAAETGLSVVTARVLLARGVDTPERVRAFMEPSLDRDWPLTRQIPGMEEAAKRVAHAVEAGERIVVFGDFDLDGISAAATAAAGLRELGGAAEATVPHRFKEGYGLTPAALERLARMRPDLVLTVDCGITSRSEVEELLQRGIDVVVTDHHEPGAGMPEGVPVTDPKLSPSAPPLAGAGVALALVRAVGETLGCDAVWRSATDLAMLGTVADMVPLTGANRALVADGLRLVHERPRPGLAALAEVSGISAASLSAEQVAYSLAPRLNAAGRMADPAIALALLEERDAEKAAGLASALDEHNRLRRAAEADLLDAALAQAERRFTPRDRVVIVAGADWHEGVRGIVASRLVARFGVPALVFCVDGDEAQGSGRSIPGVDLYEAVASTGGILTRFGGHPMAVGVTLPADRLGQLEDALGAYLAQVPSEAFVHAAAIDAEVPLDALSRELAAELALLGPFGFGNPRPMLATYGVFMNGRKRVGKTADHLRFTAYDGSTGVGSIAFRCPEIETLASTATPVDLAFELEIDEWRGVERVQLLVRDVRVREPDPQAPAADLVEDLFEHAEEILAQAEYAGIEEAERFHTKLVGVTFEGRQGVVARLKAGMPLRLERQPENEHDSNACALFDPFGDQVGFFNRRLAAALAPVLDAWVAYDVEVSEITGGAGDNLGVNVLVSRRGSTSAREPSDAKNALERRASLASLGASELQTELVRAFIGDSSPHNAQQEALAKLAEGRSVMAVMATGRGKSLVFQVHAAREAVTRGKASVFVYPLRALVADQAYAIEDRMAAIGLAVATVTGETSPDGRDAAFRALADGSLDVVLTTPEFLVCHARRFAQTGRVGFVVVDEAHHVGLARMGHRPAYARLGDAIRALGNPTVLATTATAPDDVASAIVAGLGIEAVVLDPAKRENLSIVDKRGVADKLSYVASVAARGEKAIVYVNSRDASVRLAQQLRKRVPTLAHRAVFYNGAMTREARHAVEDAFRRGDVTVVVSTSAFGEGVDIGDVRHVVLYHLPMGGVEFNQLCGRGGRDGRPAAVHLVFGDKDARLNRMILESEAPPRDDLATLYLVLKEIAASSDGAIELTNAELAERVRRRRASAALSEKGVSTGISVFRELGLVGSEGSGPYRRLTLLPAPSSKLDLQDSVRYAEGLDELAGFESFRSWVLEATEDELLHAFDRPILPTRW